MPFYISLPISPNNMSFVRSGTYTDVLITIKVLHINPIVGVVNNCDLNAVRAVSNSCPGEE